MVFLAIYFLMRLIHLPSAYYHWFPKQFTKWIRLPNFREKMTFTRFKELKANLRFEVYDSVAPDIKGYRVFCVSMTVSNAFCIYKACNPKGSEDYLDHTEFILSLIHDLYHNTYQTRDSRSARGQGNDIATAHLHKCVQAPEYSRGIEGDKRRYRAECRGSCCPDGSKSTTYGCKECGIGLHPECFGAFHESLKFGMVKPSAQWVKVLQGVE